MILKTTTKYLLGAIAVLLMAMFCAFNISDNNDFDMARQEIMLRKIGHEVLLHSGDSTSRVLPVKKTAENEYQITFQNEFTFQSDSLVTIIKRSLAQNNLTHNYIVNVLNCAGKDVIFGYAILGKEQDNIVPCSGRKQPKSCYRIDVKFQKSGITPIQKGYLLGSLPMLAFVGLLISRSVKTRKKQSVIPIGNDSLKIGNTLFDANKRHLIFDDTIIELTAKENKLFLIFATSPNVIVERARLQKEIWEDEGVIVGRSLDVFISKLRKKLENDKAIQITNVHGRGYKLDINN
ncbi:MAG: winged helix-turn-helix domain-containing protein [Mucilaginibacter sp.]|uniref:winged helix-turn-helix domain-containing protein n=1 Tax=Mucilaginibacter sp. TaxID=1882438 RepID=UPI003264F9D2